MVITRSSCQPDEGVVATDNSTEYDGKNLSFFKQRLISIFPRLRCGGKDHPLERPYYRRLAAETEWGLSYAGEAKQNEDIRMHRAELALLGVRALSWMHLRHEPIRHVFTRWRVDPTKEVPWSEALHDLVWSTEFDFHAAFKGGRSSYPTAESTSYDTMSGALHASLNSRSSSKPDSPSRSQCLLCLVMLSVPKTKAGMRVTGRWAREMVCVLTRSSATVLKAVVMMAVRTRRGTMVAVVLARWWIIATTVVPTNRRSRLARSGVCLRCSCRPGRWYQQQWRTGPVSPSSGRSAAAWESVTLYAAINASPCSVGTVYPRQ